jgi:myo-inositol-1(or 4)-monophosphatase
VSDDFDDMTFVARATEIAREAGEIALDFFRHGEKTTASVAHKEGGSPVTEADKRVDDFLRARLSLLAPDAGWLSEETVDNAERLGRDRLFIVDPIDGTRAFMAGDRRWGVCIALVRDGRPEAGIVHMPALEETFVGIAAKGASRNGDAISVSRRTRLTDALIAGPVSTLKSLTASGFEIRTEPRIPSLAYRVVRVADGSLDGSIASTNACDWDIAAADIILREAGGRLIDIDGRQPLYNRPEVRHGVLCAAPDALHAELAQALRETLGKRPQ